ncbi:hypothetical protein HUK80_10695 [Flavobacterium sp. MAH-1]|uniref:Uncharacterized protein n=2 Tax=Flavobacterium agri TaxID=2743471 RepID=A0A7Y8Y4Z7_9FLAO|nr:hypothetical protein [Flavobacterium agri]NYA71390.1 hypothetical protein [Flavobacterium agri]
MTAFAIASFTLLCMYASAQKRTVIAGDYKNLKDIKEFNLVFDYKGLMVDKSSEEGFLKDRMEKRSDENAQEFRDGWFADRENRYEPKFVESFNKRFEGSEVTVAEGRSDAKYTIKVKTTWIHPGFNAGVVRSTSAINVTVSVFETSNPDNLLLSVNYEKVPGKGAMGFDYNSGYRISEAYAKLGKAFGNDIRKKSKG